MSQCLSDLAHQASLMASPEDPVLTVFCPGLPLLLAGSRQCGCPLSTPPLTCSGDPHREAQACPHPVGRTGGGQESKGCDILQEKWGLFSHNLVSPLLPQFQYSKLWFSGTVITSSDKNLKNKTKQKTPKPVAEKTPLWKV